LDPITDWFRELYLERGINLTIVYDDFDRRRMLRGLWMTIQLSAICLVLSVVIGIAGAWMQGSRFGVAKRIVQGYIQFFRNTPPLVQLYFFFFAIGGVLPRVENEFGFMEPMIGNVAWAIIALSFFAGAFNVEIFRSGIEAVPRIDGRGGRVARLQPAGRPTCTSCCRSPSASACRRSTTTSSTSSRRRRSPMPSRCRRCSTWPTRSGPTR
jgi:His/Glu/Gln/Arg/opine family amino acid ABC transporter permease subunit